jgi:hypothetical protein
MQINESLNLVLPVSETVKAYHTPISREVYEANFRILAATKAAIFSKGIHYAAGVGPEIAALTLKEEGKLESESRGVVFDPKHPEKCDFGASAFLKEIERMTTILAPGDQGYDMVPVDAAIAQGVMDLDDWRDLESAIVFFTCQYAMNKKAVRKTLSESAALVTGGLITSLSLTEYADSLRTLTKAEPTKKVASSLPV